MGAHKSPEGNLLKSWDYALDKLSYSVMLWA